MDWIRTAYSGRLGRKNFIILAILISILKMLLGTTFPLVSGVPLLGQPLVFLIAIAVLVYTLHIWVRRFHDLGHSGWWTILLFVPFETVGPLLALGVFIYLAMMAGDNGANAYGDPEKPTRNILSAFSNNE
jgi:uncharacterized membrane protein YhaH (DUF805 family)